MFLVLFCVMILVYFLFFFFQAEDGIRDFHVTGVQTCALPIFPKRQRNSPRGQQCLSASIQGGGERPRAFWNQHHARGGWVFRSRQRLVRIEGLSRRLWSDAAILRGSCRAVSDAAVRRAIHCD